MQIDGDGLDTSHNLFVCITIVMHRTDIQKQQNITLLKQSSHPRY